jgi:RNA polymerase sigma factor (sigma-70 family)
LASMQLFDRNRHLNRWIQGAKEGDPRAQKSIYDMLSAKMYAVCLRYMGDRESACDVLQDGFVTLFSKLDTYSGEGSFEGWARRIFINTALMSLRRHDVMTGTEDIETAYSLADEGMDALQSMNYRELLDMVATLPAGFRTVFNMYVIEGYSHKEIGQKLGIEEATSRSQLQRARMLLQEKIKGRK